MSIVATIIHWYVIILIVRILATWIPASPWSNFGKFVRALGMITDPILNPIRRIIPPIRAGGVGIDISAMLLIVVLTIIANNL